MKKIVFCVIFTNMLYAQQCEPMLKRSIELTNKCFSQIEKIQETIASADWYTDENIAGLLLQNEDLLIENAFLAQENKKLKEKNIAVMSKSALLEKNLNKERAKLTLLLKNIKMNVGTADIHYDSKELKRKYSDAKLVSLIKKGIYRVPVHMLNVRYGPSSSYSISNVLKEGEFVKFTKLKKIQYKGKDVVWIKINNGWVYVPNKRDASLITSLEKEKGFEFNTEALAFKGGFR